jgi:hypothetical protein
MKKVNEKGVSKLRWASIMYPATRDNVAGHCTVVWDTEDKTYTIRFIPPDLNPKHMFYSGVLDELYDSEGNSITKAKFGNVCDKYRVRLKPALSIHSLDVKEYHTLHFGEYSRKEAKGNKIILSMQAKSTSLFDSNEEAIAVTVEGKASASYDAAKRSLWDTANKLYPGIHWKGDLTTLMIADSINIDIDDDEL